MSGFQRAVVILLALNAVLLAGLLLQGGADPRVEESQVTSPTLDDVELLQYGVRLQQAYNQLDGQALYGFYHPDAKAKLSQAQVSQQLADLHPQFGLIEQLRYLRHSLLGEQDEQRFWEVHFSANLDQPDLKQGQLRLHLIEQNGRLQLYGMKLYADLR